MARYPLQFHVQFPRRFTGAQLGLRMMLLLLVALAGFSISGVISFLYLGLPLLAALRVSHLGTGRAYLREDTDRIIQAMRWLASYTSWVSFVVEALPVETPSKEIELSLQRNEDSNPSVNDALIRVVAGLPSAAVLFVLGLLGSLVWLWCATTILMGGTVPVSAHRYLAGLQRYTYRLLAYQACLTEVYPPFRLSDDPADATPLHQFESAASSTGT